MFGFETIGREHRARLGQRRCCSALGVVCMLLYVRHAGADRPSRARPAPAGVPTFRASVIGGFLFRMGIGALPFLLPLLLQAGFGLSAVQIRPAHLRRGRSVR